MKKVYLGIDIGSSSTKAVLIDDKKDIIESSYIRSKNIDSSINEILKNININNYKIAGAGVTGSGREYAKKLINADIIKTEIIAHAIGTLDIVPSVRTIIDIGCEDCKIILLEEGVMRDFNMNTICLKGDANITTENFTNRAIDKIKIGDKVLTHTGKFRRVEKTFKRRYKGDLLEISCNKLKTLNITPEHPIFSLKREGEKYKRFDYNPKFIPARELKKRDFIAIPYFSKIEKIKYREEQFFRYKDWLFVPIKKINKSKFNGNVYNLKVEEDDSYIANLLPVHNCSSGMGATLENISSRLGIKIEEFGDIAIKSDKDIIMPMKCGVLMSSAVTSKKNAGEKIENILMAVCDSVARNFLDLTAKGKSLKEPIVFQGMTAHNKGLVKSLEKFIGKKIIIPNKPELMGAFGMAIITKEEMKSKSTFNFNKIDTIKITHNNHECIGCGICYNSLPKYFKQIEDGKSICIKEEVDKEDVKDVKEVASLCPKNLIII